VGWFGNQSSTSLLDTLPHSTPSVPTVSPKQLYDYLQNSPDEVLVLDCRPRGEYLTSHVDAKRFQQTTELLRYGFRFYRTARLFEPAQALTQVRVWGGLRKFADLGLMNDFYVTYPKVSGGKVRTELSVREDVSAPVERHQTLGAARAFFADRLLREEPLAALEMVPQGGFFRRLSDGFMRLFE